MGRAASGGDGGKLDSPRLWSALRTAVVGRGAAFAEVCAEVCAEVWRAAGGGEEARAMMGGSAVSSAREGSLTSTAPSRE